MLSSDGTFTLIDARIQKGGYRVVRGIEGAGRKGAKVRREQGLPESKADNGVKSQRKEMTCEYEDMIVYDHMCC